MRRETFTVYFIIIFLLTAASAASFYYLRTAHFADPNLEQVIREVLGKPKGTLLKKDLAEIYELDAGGRGINYLDGIQSLKNLRALNLIDNQVKDVTPLKNLTKLQVLSLRNNEITDLTDINLAALKNLPELKSLSLRHNVVRQEDSSQTRISNIAVLENFTQLEKLELRDNHIQDITPLQKLENLRVLDISQNPLAEGNIDPLKDLTKLQELNLRETGIKDLSSLKNMPDLEYLNIHSNTEIENLEPVGNLKNLRSLIMRNVCTGGSLDFLAKLTLLSRLNIRNCSVQDISALGDLMSRGALQDNPALEIGADVDIRENPIPEKSRDEVDGYAPLRPYWGNITIPKPEVLPAD